MIGVTAMTLGADYGHAGHELAGAIELTPTHLTKRIRRLAGQDLVRREPSPEDRRGVLAVITREGRVRVQPAVETYTRAIRMHYLNRLSRQQMIALGDNCRRISASLSAARPVNTRRAAPRR